MLELVSVMELGVIRGPVDPHSVNDFEPAMAESPYGISMAAILLAVMSVVKLGPNTTG